MQDESLLSSEGTEQPLPLDDRLRQLIEALQQGKAGSEFDFLMLWTDGEIAAALEALPLPERQRAWERVPEERRGSVLACMSEPARAGLLKRLDVEEVVTATSDLMACDSFAASAYWAGSGALRLGYPDHDHRRSRLYEFSGISDMVVTLKPVQPVLTT
jgi:hypothetical protein